MAYSENKEYSFLAASSTGIAAGLRVKLDGNLKIVPAGVADYEIGVTRSMSSNGLDPVRVLLRNAPGTVEMTAASAFAKGATVLRAADGKIDDTGAGATVGIAMQAATDAGDIIEVLPSFDASLAEATLTAALAALAARVTALEAH